MNRIMTSSLAIAAFLAVTTAPIAEAQNIVTLKSQDQAVNLTGELISFEDDVYVIETNLGSLRISAERVECTGAGCPQPEPVVEANVFTPGPVTLRAASGSTELSGTLLSAEDGIYLIETSFGTLQVSAKDSICEGEACPVDRVASKDVAIVSSRELSGGLVASLVEGFAAFKNTSLSDAGSDGNQQQLQLAAADGAAFANMTLAASSASEAVQKLIAGQADLAAMTRSILEDERAALFGDGEALGDRAQAETIIALDAIAIAVSPQNPLRAVAEENIARIFSGEITDWADLGGKPGPINLYVRDLESGTGAVFEQLVLTPALATMSGNVEVLGSDEAVTQAVLNDPNGIGFTSFSQLGDAQALDVRGACGIQTPANEFTIKTEEYPLARRIFMYRPQNSIPQPAMDFVEFISSSDAQNIVKSHGFIGQDVTKVSINEQGLRFASAVLPTGADATFPQIQALVSDLVAADRMSLTFRFEPGSALLDARAKQDVLRLANMIRDGKLAKKELIIAGFTDAIGLGELNQNLSLARAEQVRNAVLEATGLSEADVLPIKAVGYGELAPLGCNDTYNGRRINRRVEVWLQDAVGARTN